MPLSKQALRVLNNTNFPNNNSQYISPELLREFNGEMITSMELTQSMSEYAVLNGGNAFIGSQSIDGYVSIDKTKALNTNGIYWNNNVVGYTNLEIVNSSPNGNVNIGAIGGKVQIVSSSLNITNGTFSASLENGYAWVGDGNNRTSLVPTSSFGSVTSAITGSSLITASFSGNTLTFTKGDSSTFGVVIPDVSGSTIPVGTISGSSQITALGFVSSSVTGSSLITGSVSGNVLTFTKGDATQFSLTVATGSGGGGSTDTGSLLVTASFDTSTRNITFTKGDATQFNLGGFATTGSNSGNNRFVGEQQITSSLNALTLLGYGKRLNFGDTSQADRAYLFLAESDGNNQGTLLSFSGQNSGVAFAVNDTATPSTGSTPVSFENQSRSGSILFNNSGNTGTIKFDNATGSINLKAGGEIRVTGSSTIIQDVNFIPFSSSLNSRILAITGSSTDTGSLLVTASFNGNLKEITFTKGDTNQFVLGGFATTGSNTFRGSQTIETSSVLTVGSNEEFIKTEFNSLTLQNKTAAFVSYLAPVTQFQSTGNFNFQNTAASVGSGSMSFLIQNGGSYSTTAEGGGNIGFTTSGSSGGNIGFTTNTGSISSNITNGGSYSATVNGGGNISFSTNTGSVNLTTQGEINLQGAVRIKQKDGSNAVTVVNSSGSLLYSAASYTSASLHLSQSSATQNTSVNFVFKTNNNTPDTIISGSNNIFVNPAAPTAGFKRYFGGSGNIVLSTLAPQISGSMGFSPTMNNNIWGGSAGGPIMRGPVSSSTWTISNNIATNTGNYNIGTAAATNAEKIVSGLSITGNVGSVFPAIQGWKTPLSASVGFSNNNGSGNVGMLCDSSSISVSGNTFNGGTTINNSYFPATVNSSATINVANSSVFGTTIVNASGSDTTFTGVQPRGVYNSIVGGYSTIGLVLNGDNAAVNSSVIIGGGLVVTGSNSKVVAATANTDYGSAFFGRWNAQDGNRAISGPTVFAVGAGTSTSLRKTAFLIDSGSNTFVEGTLNVSGSSTFNGNTTITGSLILSSSNAVELYVIGVSEHTGSIKLAPASQLLLATGSNQQAGTAVLDGANPGTVTVSNSLVTADSIIMLTKQTLNHTNGYVAVSAKSAGSFTITSNHNGDTDTVGWFIINNS